MINSEILFFWGRAKVTILYSIEFDQDQRRRVRLPSAIGCVSPGDKLEGSEGRTKAGIIIIQIEGDTIIATRNGKLYLTQKKGTGYFSELKRHILEAGGS